MASTSLYNVQTSSFKDSLVALNSLDPQTFAKEVLEPLALHSDLAPQHKAVSELVKHIVERGAQTHASIDKIAGELRPVMKDDHLKSLLKYYQLFIQQLMKKMEHSPVVPLHLSDVHWRLQLQLANKDVDRILAPTAIFQLNLTGPEGDLKEKVSLELGHEQMYELFNQLEDIQEQLDALS